MPNSKIKLSVIQGRCGECRHANHVEGFINKDGVQVDSGGFPISRCCKFGFTRENESLCNRQFMTKKSELVPLWLFEPYDGSNCTWLINNQELEFVYPNELAEDSSDLMLIPEIRPFRFISCLRLVKTSRLACGINFKLLAKSFASNLTAEIINYMNYPNFESMEAAEEFFLNERHRISSSKEATIIITSPIESTQEENQVEFIGVFHLAKLYTVQPELKFWIKPSLRQQGLGKEVIDLVKAWLVMMDTLPYIGFLCRISSDNIAAKKLLSSVSAKQLDLSKLSEQDKVIANELDSAEIIYRIETDKIN